MSERLNELAEIVLEKMWKLGYQHRGLIDAHAETADRWAGAAAERDKLADEIATLRAQLAAVKNGMTQMGRDIEYWRGSQQQAIEARDLMKAEIETLRGQLATAEKDRDHWRESRQQAIEAGDFMRDEIATLRAHFAEAGDNVELERLRLEVVKLRTLNDALLENSKRLRVCVQRVCEHVELFEHCPTSMRTAILQDLADCDAGNPAQASDTTGGAE